VCVRTYGTHVCGSSGSSASSTTTQPHHSHARPSIRPYVRPSVRRGREHGPGSHHQHETSRSESADRSIDAPAASPLILLLLLRQFRQFRQFHPSGKGNGCRCRCRRSTKRRSSPPPGGRTSQDRQVGTTIRSTDTFRQTVPTTPPPMRRRSPPCRALRRTREHRCLMAGVPAAREGQTTNTSRRSLAQTTAPSGT